MSSDQDQQHPLQKERILSRGERKRAAQRARQQAQRNADSMPAVEAVGGAFGATAFWSVIKVEIWSRVSGPRR